MCGEANFQFANFQSTNFQLADSISQTSHNFVQLRRRGVEWRTSNMQTSNLQTSNSQTSHKMCAVKQNSNLQTFITCVCGEANFQNFQFTNFHNINFQKWLSISPCMSHGCQCLHACHMVVNVSMHITWWSMYPCISHGVQCLHAYHMVSNVSIHITQW